MRAFLCKLNCICRNRVFLKVGFRSKVTGRLVPKAATHLIAQLIVIVIILPS